MYMMFQAPAFRHRHGHRVDQISQAQDHARWWRPRLQRDAAAASPLGLWATRNSLKRLASLRCDIWHLSPPHTWVWHLRDSLQIGCAPARPRHPLADAMVCARTCAGEWLELLWRTYINVDMTPQSGGIGEQCRSHVTGRH